MQSNHLEQLYRQQSGRAPQPRPMPNTPEAILERLNEIPTGAEEIEVIGIGHRWIVSVILALSVLGGLIGFWSAELS